jgi:hypothetical protein
VESTELTFRILVPLHVLAAGSTPGVDSAAQ